MVAGVRPRRALRPDGRHPPGDRHGLGPATDRLLPGDRDKDADDALRTSHDALYAAYWSRLRPLPGAVDLLRACKAQGLSVVLASSAGEAESRVLRAALDAEDAIDGATFSGDVDRTKPAPDLVQVALEKAAVPPGQAVFVGDTIWDVRASGKAGVPCIGLLSGGIGREELADAGAAQVYAGHADLLARLPESLLGRQGAALTGRRGVAAYHDGHVGRRGEDLPCPRHRSRTRRPTALRREGNSEEKSARIANAAAVARCRSWPTQPGQLRGRDRQHRP